LYKWYTGVVPEQYKRTPNTACVICGKEIYRRPGVLKSAEGKGYCSSACYGVACRKEKPCIVCGTLMLSGLHKRTCSRSCSNKNRLGTTYKNLFGLHKDKVKAANLQKIRLMNKRGKRCERCGYSVYQILQIHHQDRDRNHNDLKNLELLCPNCHAKEHYLKN
jgi:hypothetical protein